MNARDYIHCICCFSLVFLASCASQIPTRDQYSFSEPVQWGVNAFVFGSGSNVTTVRVRLPVKFSHGSPVGIGNCDFDRKHENWTCPSISYSIADEIALGQIFMFTGTAEQQIQRIQSAGYYVQPHEMTGSYLGWVNGKQSPARVFLLGTDGDSSTLNIFFDHFQVWAYLKNPDDVQQKVLSALALSATLPDELSSFDQFMYDQETSGVGGTQNVTLGTFHLTLPQGYSASAAQTWSGSLIGPNGYCIVPKTKNTMPAGDSEMVHVTRDTNRYEWLWFSTPNLCKSLLEADRYCLKNVTKKVPLGKGTISLTTIYNNPAALDYKHVDKTTGEVPCLEYKPKPSMYFGSEGCRDDNLCVFSIMKPAELENVLGRMTE